MRFELPLLLWLAPAGFLVIGLLGGWAQRRRRQAARAWSPALAAVAGQGRRTGVPLLALAGLAAGFGAAGPRGGPAERLSEGRGLNVLFAIDISRSMLAEDEEPNRLRRSVREARRLLQDLGQDRVGVLAFAGQSYVLAPLTLDHSAADMFLEALDPDFASAGGTELIPVFEQARLLLGSSLEGGDRVLVLFTDGEAHDSVVGSLDAARELASSGVQVVLVASGGVEPVRIPLRDATGRLAGYKRDEDGEIVLTARRDNLLQVVANATSGTVIPADLPDQAGAVRDYLRGLARRPLRERRLADLEPLAWMAGLAAALLLLLQTGTRRTSALAGLAGLMVAGQAAAQHRSVGDRHAEAGRLSEAAQAYRSDALRGLGGDTAWYNAGVMALSSGEFEQAEDALRRAAGSLDPALRFRALYNLGLTNLLAARSDTANRAGREQAAREHLRQALLLDPGSRAAKWNLELLEQQAPPQQSSRQQSQPRQPEQEQRDQARAPPAEGITPAEAEALLASVERGELATRNRLARQQRLRSSSGRKDW